MPGMTDVDLARRMSQIRPDIPIIICTGYSSIISDEKAKSIGIRETGYPLSASCLLTIGAINNGSKSRRFRFNRLLHESVEKQASRV